MSLSLTRNNIWIYGSLALPLSLLGYPLGIWLPRAYDTYVGVGTALVGFVIFAAFVFDAFSDPLMGYCSDRFRTRWGRRRPWITLGVPLLAAAAYYLFNPAEGMGVLYLAFWYVFLRLGTTLIRRTIRRIPYPHHHSNRPRSVFAAGFDHRFADPDGRGAQARG